MNERIKALALQAGYKDLPTVRLAFQGFDKQKFAELIVRECAKVADGGWADPGYQITQHFGVEE